MYKIRFVFFILLMPFVLSACQTSQVGTSSFAGQELSSKPVEKRSLVESIILKNEATSSAVKTDAGTTAKKTEGPRTFVNEAASSAIRPVRQAKAQTEVSTKEASKSSKEKTVVAKASRKKGGKFSTRRNRYRHIIAKHARANGVPLRLAMAVVQVESSYRVNARGAAGEIGLMQLMPATARFIGYKGPLKKLYHPDTNIRYGMKYLGKAYRLGGRTSCGAILKYNAGHGAKRMNPISRKYCNRVAKIMRRG